MAQNENIRVNINFESNASDATADVNRLSNAINETTEATQELGRAQDGLGNSMKSSGKAVLDNGGAMGLLNDATGGLANMIKDAVEALELFKITNQANTVATEASTAATSTATGATQGLTIAQRALNLVLKANPYILIATLVAAVTGAVYAWFSVTEKQRKALQESTNAINLNAIATENLKNNVERAKSETESSNSVEIARAKALGLSEKEIQKMIQAQKDLAAITSITSTAAARQLQVEAETNLFRLRQKIGGGSAFFGGLTDAEEEQIKKAQEALKAATEFYQSQNALVDASINDANENRFNTIAENNAKIEEANQKHQNALTEQEKKAAAERKAARKKDLDEVNAIQDELETIRLEAQFKKEKEEADRKQKEHDTFIAGLQKVIDDEIKMRIALAEAKKKIEEAEFSSVEGAIRIAGMFLNKTKDQQKASLIAENALGIAKTVINTQAANQAAVSQGAALAIATGGASVAAAAGIVAANNISAGIAIATSIAATAQGLIAIGAGGSPTGGNAAAAAGAGAQPNVSFQASSGNAIAGAIVSTKQKADVIKAYVVASEVTTQQSLDANKISSTSI